jgi:prepilin-type N-terminal cleavage/methylation domain-containing protein
MRRSKDSPYWGQQGFTLLELLLALMMFALIAGAIFAAFAAITDGVEKGRQSGEIYRVARGAIQHLTRLSVAGAMPRGCPELYLRAAERRRC